MTTQPYDTAELTELLELQEEATSRDAGGGLVEGWQKLAYVYGHMRPMSGGERVTSDRTEGTAEYLAVIRSRVDVSEKNRIVWRGRAYNIAWVRDRKPNALFLEVECMRGVAL